MFFFDFMSFISFSFLFARQKGKQKGEPGFNPYFFLHKA